MLKGFSFMYDGRTVEIVNEYKYLGIIFKPSGSFSEAINYLCKKALKALFCIRKAIASEYMNVELFLKLYEHCVKPILLYCSEVWCLGKIMNRVSVIEKKYDTLAIEKIQLKFCKILLGVHKSATSNAVRAELGIFPLGISCLKASVNFWLHVLELNNKKLVCYAYNDETSCDSGLGHNIKLLLEKINFSHIWENQGTFSKHKLLNAVTVRLKDSYISFWNKCLFDDSGNAANGNKLRTYRIFKSSYCLEKYLLTSINSRKEISTFAKIRISCHKLFIEEGRYRKIPIQERICQLCHTDIEDEKHFILSCPILENTRKSYFDSLNDIYPAFSIMNNSDKFNFIMSSKDYDLNTICISFIYELYNERSNLFNNGLIN